jgi:2-polyprenyl-6-methoxyphenol hydroxylase-like FAD-dependent oxidoreductase
VPRWSDGRAALVGDAAYCSSLLADEGSGFAMAGAYILAGELHRFGGDHTIAFAAYEQKLRPFMLSKQKSARAFAASFTPRTSLGLFVRDAVFWLASIPLVANLLMSRFIIDRFSLPQYEN